ncbi:MAG: dus1 [Oscillospiraceae bacterium]|jgi:nifR3 family TIM-barrel protein|nr:dus1 [Oscillospiraceae bacterium]
MKYLNIGAVKIEKTAALAPMASVADRAFREMCKRFGAAYVVGEMASSKGLFYSDRKTQELLTVTQAEQPMAVQLFGDDPDFMARAAVKCLEYAPQVIDINMGCPVPKVAGSGSGSALMKTPELAEQITKAMVRAVDIPVTVKIRKGWDDQSVNAVDFAKRMEQCGVSAITVHGRTRQQMYTPPVDTDIIRQVKEAVKVPVIGNGDVTDVQTCIDMYEKTGCDLVMIGRGAYGKPWLFEQIRQYFETGKSMEEPDLEQRMNIMLEHIKLICEYKGEYIGMKEARKHAAWYLKGLHGAASLRRDCGTLSSYEDIEKLVCKALAQEIH